MINLFALSGLLTFLTCTVLIVITLKSKGKKLRLPWIMFNIAVAIWGLGSYSVGRARSPSDALLWWRIAHIGIILIPVFMYHVVKILCDLKQKRIFAAIYIQALLFLTLDLANPYGIFLSGVRPAFSFYYGTLGPLYHIFFIIWISIVSFSHYELFLAFFRFQGIKKTQITYLLLATFVGFLGGLTNFIPAYGIDIFPYGNLTIPLYCIIVTYAILRYRLMDVHFVIRIGMVYSLSAGILASLFVVLVLAMTKYIETVAGMTSYAITIIAALIIAVLFNPLKNNLQKIIDKTFYKRTYNYFDIIRDISRKLTIMFELNTIYEFIANILYDTFGLRSIYVLSTESGRNCSVVYQRISKHMREKKVNIAQQGNLSSDAKMIHFMIENEDILAEDELPEFEDSLGADGIQRIKDELKLFEGKVAASVFIEGHLALILILGEKLSGDMFTREDINLLKTVSDQISIAAKNARLYKENLDSEKLASVGMMAATFAHEVRNPLTSLKTFAQLMPEKYNDEEFRDGFSKIVVGEIQKIDDLISDLLDFSSEKKSARVTEFDLVGIMDETIDYVRGKLGLSRQNINIEKKYARDSFIMMGDVKQLQQLFINLVTNGCQAMSGEGTLRVEICPDGDRVEVAITDTGQGIHPDDIQKIFDPFVTNKETGTGLGLSISKKIVEEHDGSISVESTLSEGSTFTVTLPVQKK